MVEVGGFTVEDGVLLFLDRDKTHKALDKALRRCFWPLERHKGEGRKKKGKKRKEGGEEETIDFLLQGCQTEGLGMKNAITTPRTCLSQFMRN